MNLRFPAAPEHLTDLSAMPQAAVTRLTKVSALILLVDGHVTLRSQVMWRPDDPVTQHPEQQQLSSSSGRRSSCSPQEEACPRATGPSIRPCPTRPGPEHTVLASVTDHRSSAGLALDRPRAPHWSLASSKELFPDRSAEGDGLRAGELRSGSGTERGAAACWPGEGLQEAACRAERSRWGTGGRSGW
ncbi:unnamed protein product [Pleuronectes platessa]|uniref:Uncharacterized protein n=1 Tax=Pleuronectes platessa TaxID=8262 RepID=A0A9N7U4M6_PLEPL|nr:unnamed protein product [Pleuronectes platessa]